MLEKIPMDDNSSVTCRIVGRFSDAEVLLSRSLEGQVLSLMIRFV